MASSGKIEVAQGNTWGPYQPTMRHTDGTAYELPEGATVLFTVKKPSDRLTDDSAAVIRKDWSSGSWGLIAEDTGIPVGALASALGLGGDATEQEVAAVIAKATPEQLLALKQADNEFATKMRELDVEFDRIAAADRDSARKREMERKDWIPGALAIVLTLGFFWDVGLPDVGCTA